jgi:16S rRNA (cytidine1402-2'-O)-methyltransferase
MSGTLFVVATPIGNLEDITLRALRVLREVDLVAAEDTRRTAKLLTHYGISTPTVSFHEHNSRARLPGLIAKLESGLDIAVVSDAGTPGIADPGVALVRECRQRAIAVDPLPGACAPLAAAVASGFSMDPLKIHGFAPARSKDRQKWFKQLQTDSSTLVFFEAPHRILKTLSEIPDVFVDRPICVARELTKIHQQVLTGLASEIIGHLTNVKGEFTVVVGPAAPQDSTELMGSDESIFEEFCRMTDSGIARRSAVSALAKKYGRPARSVYAAIESSKKAQTP